MQPSMMSQDGGRAPLLGLWRPGTCQSGLVLPAALFDLTLSGDQTPSLSINDCITCVFDSCPFV